LAESPKKYIIYRKKKYHSKEELLNKIYLMPSKNDLPVISKIRIINNY
jgi:hypothetical protein